MLGFETFRGARILLSGIELMHMIKKGQLKDSGNGQTPVDTFLFIEKISIPYHSKS